MALDLLFERPASDLRGLRNHAMGACAESLVAAHYLDRGHRLLARRYRSRRGEIDLVLSAPSGELVFVEVKSSRSHDEAAALLTPSQVGRVMRAAEDYLAQFHGHLDVEMRFDLALVDRMARVERVENAFL